ncbi:hypothetical protein [Archangium lansingense]|uniref:Uncharacterized protein n=1 Tax=Archangium lansingense TaxID=2995310 RepID=A0ABT4AF18_9BACT|nr:hypothetical protein [Archangium lansinium]MCY1080277.1 hypothetical protein [Archangium lansinium]
MNIRKATASVRVRYNRAREGRAMHSARQRGNQLGPYVLGPRFKSTGDMGRIYRAHNVVTGAPALVLQRTERQDDEEILADWTVRVTSSVSPAFVALEVESAPRAGDPADVPEELVFMLRDAEELANATINRPETMPHLRAARRPPSARHAVTPRPAAPTSRNWQRPSLAAGIVAAVAAALLHLGASNSGISGNMLAGAELAQGDWDAGWDASLEATGLVLTTTADDLPIVLARALPKKPFANQKRPPCKVKEKLEVELFGGCWVPHEVRAPCPDELYELGGKCYLPAAKPESSPTAISGRGIAFDRP